MTMKAHILAALEEQIGRWQELLAGLSDEQIHTPQASSPWTLKDVLVHLWAWQQRSIARMEAARSGREPEFPRWNPEADPEAEDVDETNAWIYETYRTRPWPAVHQQWETGYRQLLKVSEGVSEKDLLDGSRYPWMEGYSLAQVLLATYDHHQEHLDETLAWLEAHE